MIGSVTTMVVASLLVVRFLDRPYTNASGSIKPTAMTATLRQMERRDKESGSSPAQLCSDADGRVACAASAVWRGSTPLGGDGLSRRADLSLQVGVSQWPEPSLT